MQALQIRDPEKYNRAKTISSKQLAAQIKRDAASNLDVDESYEAEPALRRPRTRAECASVPRPCPFVSCRYSLYLDVKSDKAAIKFNFPGLEPGEMTESCALDVADQGGMTLQQVAVIVRLTRERVRQIEEKALQKGVRKQAAKLGFR